MASNQLYSLTWGQFGTSLVSAVQLLRCHGDLVDVTLAAGGRSFPAHKVVLCAASPFLLDLLKSTPCKHPIVMLAGVTATDLEALLEFVYRGEVSIDPNQLPSLLQAAHCLNIQGLAPATTQISETNIQHPTIPQQLVKNIIDVNKSSDVSQTTNDSQDILSGDELTSQLSIRRRKRLKRKNSGNFEGKPTKYYIPEQNENDNRSTESNDNEYAVTVIEQGDGGYKYTAVARKSDEINCQATENSTTWSNQQLNLVNASTSTVDKNLTHSNIIPPLSSNHQSTSTVKLKAASDQPGACPLCGAMLRQARNLRRHLLTSCKYRMVNEVSPVVVSSIVNASGSVNRHHLQDNSNNLHQPHPMQNIERVTQSNASVLNSSNLDSSSRNDTKNNASFTPISCSEIIPGTSTASNSVEQ